MTPPRKSFFQFRASVLIGLCAALIIVGYSFYAGLPYLMGPSLTVTEITENGETTISGGTARVSYLTIDGGEVPLEKDGSFRAVRSYPSGYTAVQVSVKDRFGRTYTKTLSFLNN